MKRLPERGSSLDEVMTALRALEAHDADYHNARTWSLIYNAGPDVDEVLQTAASHVLLENALNPFVFPSLREMQRDVVAIVNDLLHGDDDTGGTMTSGGTESIFMAVKTARDRMRAERGIRHGRIVIPKTAHPAFVKAAHYLDLEWVQMPLREDLRTHAEDLEPLLTEDTVLAVGSAPAYPFGMIDPIPEMAALAAERGIPFHVDACLGGLLLPFLERLGYQIPPWDFRVEGVTSISADVHKYGYAIKGASVVLHRPKSNLRYQVFQFADWPGGLYGTQAFLGTKPAAPIAAAWAVLHYLGEEGYLRLAQEAMEATERLIAGIRATPGLHVWGEPEMTVLAVGSRERDIFAIGDALNAKGWHFDRQENPPAIHLMVSPRHALVIDEFLTDLREAVATAAGSSTTVASYGDDVRAEAGGT
ncbi:MAG TPA: aminotransferase class V-fold PLP-dependent enzyme [Dehalococcoidia bacterium]|nr:aminotransferase class V-fold PLP-dependent enzyme [Dehalococcoidia bacterium]